MGIPQFGPINDFDPYPVFEHCPPDTVKKRLAGNVA